MAARRQPAGGSRRHQRELDQGDIIAGRRRPPVNDQTVNRDDGRGRGAPSVTGGGTFGDRGAAGARPLIALVRRIGTRPRPGTPPAELRSARREAVNVAYDVMQRTVGEPGRGIAATTRSANALHTALVRLDPATKSAATRRWIDPAAVAGEAALSARGARDVEWHADVVTDLDRSYDVTSEDGLLTWTNLAAPAAVLACLGGGVGRAASTVRRHRQQADVHREDSRRDALTGLWIRTQLDVAVAEARQHGAAVGLVYVDLDGFKSVNDTQGHHAGYQVLKVVVSDPADLHQVSVVGVRIIDAVSRPMTIDGTVVNIGASCGAVFDETGDCEADDLVRSADAALYVAKEAGRGRTVTGVTGGDSPASRAVHHVVPVG